MIEGDNKKNKDINQRTYKCLDPIFKKEGTYKNIFFIKLVEILCFENIYFGKNKRQIVN